MHNAAYNGHHNQNKKEKHSDLGDAKTERLNDDLSLPQKIKQLKYAKYSK